MNLELLLETLRGSRYLVGALLLAAVLDAGLYGFRTGVQQPELASMQKAYFASRAAGGRGASERTLQYQSSLRDLAQFQQRLIPKKEFGRFLEELFSMAQKHSLSLNGISYKPGTVKGQPLVSYAMTLTISGRYQAIKSFIADLSHYPMLVTVDSVSLRNSSTTEEAVQLQLQITAFLKTEGA